jgi:hypothetical protein
MRISHIRYQPIEGGTLGGHFALHVKLGADSDPESFSLNSTELATKIHEAYEILDLKSQAIRGVLIDTRLDELVDATEMMALIGTLRDWNMTVVAWVGEKRRASWFEKVNYLTVFIHDKNWPNFKVNEIRYEPIGDTLIEPDIFEVNQNVPGYVYCDLQTSAVRSKILAFVFQAKRPWGVIGNYTAVAFPMGKNP